MAAAVGLLTSLEDSEQTWKDTSGRTAIHPIEFLVMSALMTDRQDVALANFMARSMSFNTIVVSLNLSFALQDRRGRFTCHPKHMQYDVVEYYLEMAGFRPDQAYFLVDQIATPRKWDYHAAIDSSRVMFGHVPLDFTKVDPVAVVVIAAAAKQVDVLREVLRGLTSEKRQAVIGQAKAMLVKESRPLGDFTASLARLGHTVET